MASFLNYLQVIVGLGVVIFVHELGHFLLAKFNGVKVEKFSIGFGTPLVAWRRGVGLRLLTGAPIPEPVGAAKTGNGPIEADLEPSLTPAPAVGETEYTLAAIPLGGFVKMLGEMPEEAGEVTDPRAFPNKSVGARMAIISAGVIMNVIFGLLCFAYAYRTGLIERPAVVGSVTPGSPAYEAGIRPGDEIIEIDGQTPVTFEDLQFRSMTSGRGQALNFEMKRRDGEGTYAARLEPRTDPNSLSPRVGLGSSLDTKLYAEEPYAAPPGLVGEPTKIEVQPGDRLVAAGPIDGPAEPIRDKVDLDYILSRHRDVPLRFVLGAEPSPGSAATEPSGDGRSFVLPPTPMLDLGLRLTMGPVVALQKDGPGARAGVREGDVIAKVDGRADFDPLRLPEALQAKAGHPVEVVVNRPAAGGSSKAEPVALTITPEDRPTGVDHASFEPYAPLDLPPLGLACAISPKIAAVEPGSVAAEAGLKAGETIKSVVLKSPKLGRPMTFPMEGTEAASWSDLVRLLQEFPEIRFEVLVDGATKPVELTPKPAADWYNPLRGLNLAPLERPLPPQDFASAMRRGVDAVGRNAISVYYMIRGLVQGRLSRKLALGPLGIFQVGSSAAGKGFTDLVRFLGMLSINLAVVNFLPIPPLDGGQMIFLIAEKVRGRPLPENAIGPATILGLVFVLTLMVFVLFQDVVRWLGFL